MLTNGPLWGGTLMVGLLMCEDRVLWGILYISAQLCCETQISLKSKVNKATKKLLVSNQSGEARPPVCPTECDHWPGVGTA